MMNRTVLLAAALLAAQPAAAQLYKCVLDGKVVYQDGPCAQGAKESTMRPARPGAAPAPAEETKAAPAAGGAANPNADVEAVVSVLSGYQSCANDLDGYAEKHGAAYNAWRTRNQASIAAFNKNPDAQKRVRANLEAARADRPRDAAGVESRAESCDADAARWFGARAPQ